MHKTTLTVKRDTLSRERQFRYSWAVHSRRLGNNEIQVDREGRGWEWKRKKKKNVKNLAAAIFARVFRFSCTLSWWIWRGWSEAKWRQMGGCAFMTSQFRSNHNQFLAYNKPPRVSARSVIIEKLFHILLVFFSLPFADAVIRKNADIHTTCDLRAKDLRCVVFGKTMRVKWKLAYEIAAVASRSFDDYYCHGVSWRPFSRTAKRWIDLRWINWNIWEGEQWAPPAAHTNIMRKLIEMINVLIMKLQIHQGVHIIHFLSSSRMEFNDWMIFDESSSVRM